MSATARQVKISIKPSLEDSELRYRRLFETAQDGILILDARTGRIEDVNPYLVKLLGYSRRELVEKRLWEVGAFKDIKAGRVAFRTLQKKRYVRYEDLPLKTKDGRLIEVEFISNVYLVGGKKVIQCDIRDITEHRRIIAALQANEKRYHDLVDHSPDGMFILELSGKILSVNESMCRELGFSREEFLSAKIWDLIPKRYLAPHRASLTSLLEGKSGAVAADYAIQGKDGKIHHVEIISAPQYAGKDIIGFYGIARDLTARKRAEEDLASLARFPSENPNPVLRLGGDGAVLYANAASEALLASWGCLVGGPAPKFWRELAVETLSSRQNRTVDLECDGKLYSMYVASVTQLGYINLYGRDVTGRRHAEAALATAEKRYRALVENAPDAIAVIGADGTLLYDSPAAPRLLGYAAGELLGRNVLALVHPDDLAQVTSLVQEILQDASITASSLFRFHHKDGSRRWVEAIGKNLLAEPGVGGLVINYRDITDRKRAEDMLVAERDLLTTLIDHLPDNIFVKDAAGRIVMDNNAHRRLLGAATLQQVVGKTDFDFFPAELAAQYAADEKKVVQSGEALIDRTEPVIGKDSAERWLLTTKVPVRDRAGKVTEIVGINRDITERKRADAALAASESELRALFASMRDTVFVIDRDGYYREVAPTNPDVWYINPQELLGKRYHDVFSAELAALFDAAIQRVLETGLNTHIEYELIFGGKSVWYEASISRMGPDRTLWVARDITERKRTQELLRESEERYRLMLESAPLAINITRGTDITFANSAYLHMFGFASLDELKSVEPLALFAPEWRQQILENIQRRAQGLVAPGSYEVEVLRQDGTRLPVQMYFTRTVFSDGPATVGFIIDIADRKRAEAERAALAEIMQGLARTSGLQAFLEAMRESLCKVLDAANLFVVLRNNASGLFEEVFAVDKYDAPMPPSRLERSITSYVYRTAEPLLLTGEKFEELKSAGEVELVGAQPACWLGAPLKTPAGIIGVIAVQNYEDSNCYSERDRAFLASVGAQVALAIERKQTEDSLLQSEARFSQLAQASFEGIAIHDKAKIVEANQPLADLFGYQLSEIIGMSALDLAAPESRKLVGENVLSSVETAYEAIGLRKDGTKFAGELISRSALFQGKVARATAIRDITARKQAEQELRSRTEEVSALYALSRDLANAADFGDVLDLVNRHAVESLHVTFARIALVEGSDLVTRAAYPVRVLDHDLFVGDRRPVTDLPHCEQALERHESIRLNASDQEIGAAEREGLLLDLAQSLYLVPLALGPEAQDRGLGLGILMLGEARAEAREPFSPEKMRLAQSIGDQAAAALRRMLLRDEGRRRLQHVDALHAIDSTITGSTDLSMILNVILAQAAAELGVDAVSILVLNPHIQTLEYAAARGFRTTAMQKTQVRLGEALAGRVALERRLIQIADLSTLPHDALLTDQMAGEGFVCYYGVPVIAKGQVRGVMEVFHRAPRSPDSEWFDFLNALAGQAALAIDNSALFEGLQRSNFELSAAYDATIEGWSRALDLRDKETEGHTQRVTDMTMSLARSFGLSEAELVQVRWGSLLHDMGKMGVPDSILRKPGPLTDEEWVIMKQHPNFAYEMLAPIRYLRLALDIPYCHHEKWDGTGYPRALKEEQIPLTARIFSVVDVWDALNSERPYRPAWTAARALEHILSESGKHFDPRVVEAFSAMLAAGGSRGAGLT